MRFEFGVAWGVSVGAFWARLVDWVRPRCLADAPQMLLGDDQVRQRKEGVQLRRVLLHPAVAHVVSHASGSVPESRLRKAGPHSRRVIRTIRPPGELLLDRVTRAERHGDELPDEAGAVAGKSSTERRGNRSEERRVGKECA